MIKTTENFLPIDVFDILQRKFLDGNFPWYLAKDVTNDNPNISASCEDIYNWQFVHNIFTSFVSKFSISNQMEIIEPILKIIDVNVLLKVKANLIPRADKIVEHGFHIDVNPPIENATTGILYLNTNNGYTIFEDGTKIPSVANTFISFPSTMKHSGSTCTDMKQRMIINFNYILHKK